MLKKLIDRFRSSEFLVNVSKLTTGTAIAQLISIGTAPILYRIYDKVHYGTLGLYMAITGVVGVFSTMQYLQTILLEKDDEGAINAMWLNRIINTCFALLSLLVIVLLFPFIVKWVNNPTLNKWLWFIPVSIFFAGQNEIFRIWANRKKEYNLLTFNAIFMAILTPIISIGLGLLLQNETGLFVGLIVGQSLPALLLLFGLRKKYNLGLQSVTFKRIKELAREHRQFPIYSLPQSFIGQYANSIPVFMLNSFVGAGAVGDYNLAIRMLGLPIQFIGGAITSVFSQEATKRFNTYGTYKELFLKTFKSLALISIIPVIILTLFSTEIFTLIFSEKFRTAGVIAGFMAPMFALKLINSPLSYGFYIHKLLKLDLLITVVVCAGAYIIFSVSFKNGQDYLEVLKFYTLFISLIYLFNLMVNFNLSRKMGM